MLALGKRNSLRGFTLLELVFVIVLIGVLATVSAALLRQPFDASAALQRRARLADEADQAMARISRDLRRALPNSVRVAASGETIDALRSSDGGRYRADLTASGGGDLLDFTAADSSFDVLGGLAAAPAAGQWAVVYNLTSSGSSANAWGGDNRASVGAASTAANVQLSPAFQFPFPSPQQRLYIVDGPVMFRCAGGELRRHAGYALGLAQPDPPTGGEDVLLTDAAASCQFSYLAGASSRHGLVSIRLTLTREGETVSLLKSIHLPNTP